MGLSGKAAKAPDLPPVKSVGELTTEATSANIANLPAIIEAFNKYGPEAASSMLIAAQNLNPTLKPLGDLLNKRIGEVSAGGIPETLRRAYETSFRNASAARGFADSPASANAEAIGLATEGETYAKNTFDAANAYGSNLPKAPTIGELGLTPPTIESGVQTGVSQNDTAINLAYQQQVYAAAKKKSQAAGIGGLIGGTVGLIGSGGNIGVANSFAGAGASIGGTFF